MAAITAAVIGAAGAIGGSAIGAFSANKQAKRARSREKVLSAELNALENSRQDVINPYEGVTDLSAMVSDLSSIANNPFNSLSVSTAASEMQAEQTDIALANTLDTLRATGASAGGATALARMALESKKGISANIEQQEVNNQKLRAQGEQNLQAIKLSEAQRVQGALYGEAGRMQQTEVSGKEFVYGETERRQTEQLNRKQAQITGQAQVAAQARQNQASAIGAGISAVGNIASSFASNYQRPTNPQVSSVNAGIPTYGTTVNSQIKTSAGAIPQYNGGN